VGDHFSRLIRPDDVTHDVDLVVTSIMSYERNVTRLEHAMSGELDLVGDLATALPPYVKLAGRSPD
jgi:hypothetical protein